MMNAISDIHKNTKPFVTCKDFLVSNEIFSIRKNDEIDVLITSPIPEDLNKYYQSDAYISHSDTRKSIVDILYYWVRSYTLKQKMKMLNSFAPTNKSVLDIGAGTGEFLSVCKKDNWNIFGTEPDKIARKHALKKGIELEEDIFSFQKNSFDVITLWHVLEHVPNLETYITTLKKMLKPHGTLVIAVPNYKSFDALYFKEFWAAYDVPRHVWHFSQFAISKLFAAHKLKVVKTLPMKFDAYYVSLLSEKHRSGSIKFLKSFWIGFKSNWKARKTSEYSSLIYVLKHA